jgi:hypothetical protein
MLIIGCRSEHTKLQDLWILKYSVYQMNTENEYIRNQERILFNFEKDSLEINNFEYDKIYSIPYQLKDEMTLLHEEDRIDTFYFEMACDTLSLVFPPYSRKHIFQKLPRYDLADKASKLYKLLLYSEYQAFESTRVKFRTNLDEIPDFKLNFEEHENDLIQTYEGELFLTNPFLHIKKINIDGFSATIYGQENTEIKFIKTYPKASKFEINNLIGEWIEVIDKNFPAPPIPILPEKGDVLFEKEELSITSSTIQRRHLFKVETMKWKTNKAQNLIHLPKLNVLSQYKTWNIISLSERELVIERISTIENIDRNAVDRKKFNRK